VINCECLEPLPCLATDVTGRGVRGPRKNRHWELEEACRPHQRPPQLAPGPSCSQLPRPAPPCTSHPRVTTPTTCRTPQSPLHHQPDLHQAPIDQPIQQVSSTHYAWQPAVCRGRTARSQSSSSQPPISQTAGRGVCGPLQQPASPHAGLTAACMHQATPTARQPGQGHSAERPLTARFETAFARCLNRTTLPARLAAPIQTPAA
jgi:hypothetical protein